MNIAYCSLLLPEEKKLAERSRKRLSGISLHKFTRAVIQGLDANLDKPVDVFNIINTVNYPGFPDLIFKTEQWSHAEGADDWHIGYLNLVVFKYITQSKGLYKKLRRWVASKPGEQCFIIVHHIYYPAMQAACKIKKEFGDRVKICLITGDMNGQYGLRSQNRVNLKQRLLRFVETKIDRYAKQFDCFVFATKDMADGFGVADKPFTVLECAYANPVYYSDTPDNSLNPDGNKIIFYAGALREEYGIRHLLDAFCMIEDESYRLWLAGGGAAEPLIKEYAQRDSRIEYLGFISPQEVDLRQKNATALISPRTSELDFVRYSFPSKTMECLASGKPYIAHKLPCDPPEYSRVVQYPADESDKALCDKIIEVCSLSEDERRQIGIRAKEFIVTEKNPTVMCRRIVDLFDKFTEA